MTSLTKWCVGLGLGTHAKGWYFTFGILSQIGCLLSVVSRLGKSNTEIEVVQFSDPRNACFAL